MHVEFGTVLGGGGIALAAYAVAHGRIAYRAGQRSRDREVASLQVLVEVEGEDALERWIAKIAAENDDGAICRHMRKHVNELFVEEISEARSRAVWAASMRNLLQIYEAKHRLVPSAALQLERLLSKYESDPLNQTTPPKELTGAERAAVARERERHSTSGY